ncbi:MAG TPA: hypothetical protein VL403_12790 [Candidatus Kryptonia bacterium]|nr:hypothetical protein [Candidatus Kryptonia bacterium]
MARPQPIRARPGHKHGEWVVAVPPGWELRLRRVLRAVHADALPNPREKGLTPAQREARLRARRRQMQRAIGQFVSDLITADIVGKEVALATRGRLGPRKGSLREHVYALIREA